MDPTVCVFCQRRPVKLTVEDVLPKWLLREWKRQGIGQGNVTHLHMDMGTGKDLRRQGPVLIEAKIVCATCNGEGMSNIQHYASKQLKAMIAGRPVGLDADAQRWLAAWVFMTACTWEYATPRRYIPTQTK